MKRRLFESMRAGVAAGYSISAASSDDEYAEALRLVYASYVAAGIARPTGPAFRAVEQHASPESVVLIARRNGRMVGTATVTADGPMGLPLDKDFPELLAGVRGAAQCPFEINSLAVVGRERHGGLAWILGLAGLRVGLQWLGGDALVMGTHPKAVDPYASLLGSEAISDVRRHAALDAPVVASFATIRRIERYFRASLAAPLEDGVSCREMAFGRRVLTCAAELRRRPSSASAWTMSRRLLRELLRDDRERSRLAPVSFGESAPIGLAAC